MTNEVTSSEQASSGQDEPSKAPSPAVEAPARSKTWASIGRDLHLYSTLWDGPRPCKVVFAERGVDSVTVNVFLDGYRDKPVLAKFRLSDAGNSVAGVAVYDELTPERRKVALERSTPIGSPQGQYIAEWPPRV